MSRARETISLPIPRRDASGGPQPAWGLLGAAVLFLAVSVLLFLVLPGRSIDRLERTLGAVSPPGAGTGR